MKYLEDRKHHVPQTAALPPAEVRTSTGRQEIQSVVVEESLTAAESLRGTKGRHPRASPSGVLKGVRGKEK